MSAGEMRADTIIRDRECKAPVLDADAGPCFTKWGELIEGRATLSTDLEVDYIRPGAIAPRHVLPCDHVALCPGHHRGMGPQHGRVWALANREVLSEYLRPFRDEIRSEADTNGDG